MITQNWPDGEPTSASFCSGRSSKHSTSPSSKCAASWNAESSGTLTQSRSTVDALSLGSFEQEAEEAVFEFGRLNVHFTKQHWCPSKSRNEWNCLISSTRRHSCQSQMSEDFVDGVKWIFINPSQHRSSAKVEPLLV
jgi:hypothetical protein